jgi:hypothetical protein
MLLPFGFDLLASICANVPDTILVRGNNEFLVDRNHPQRTIIQIAQADVITGLEFHAPGNESGEPQAQTVAVPSDLDCHFPPLSTLMNNVDQIEDEGSTQPTGAYFNTGQRVTNVG